MQVEQLERLVLADRAGMLSRPGVDYSDAPDVDEAIKAFDADLIAPPVPVDAKKARQLRAVGAVA